MKKFIILFIIGLSLHSLKAQTISNELMTSVGGFYSNTTAMLTFSEGVVIDDLILKAPTSQQNASASKQWLIYPNPATDFITILTPKPSKIDLLDVGGKVIKTMNSNDVQTNMNVSSCKEGLYLVRIRSEKDVWVEKFIKK